MFEIEVEMWSFWADADYQSCNSGRMQAKRRTTGNWGDMKQLDERITARLSKYGGARRGGETTKAPDVLNRKERWREGKCTHLLLLVARHRYRNPGVEKIRALRLHVNGGDWRN